jgi:hypothetical protein
MVSPSWNLTQFEFDSTNWNSLIPLSLPENLGRKEASFWPMHKTYAIEVEGWSVELNVDICGDVLHLHVIKWAERMLLMPIVQVGELHLSFV